MKLSEIFSQLTTGELSQLGIGGAEEGGIQPRHYQAVLNHINLGLMNLFTRFMLKEGRATLQLTSGIYLYPVDATNADFEIIDGEVTGSLLKVEKVLTDAGYEIPLNQPGHIYSCSTPSLKTLRVPEDIVDGASYLPEELKTNQLTVVFRASHPMLTLPRNGELNPDRVEVDLPSPYLEPLLYFVASRVHNPIGMVNEFHSGNSYAAKYEMACQFLENKNLQVDRGDQPNRLRQNGWV